MIDVPTPPVVDFVGCRLLAIDQVAFREWFAARARDRGAATRLTYLNADTFNRTRTSPPFRRLIDAVDPVFADGQSIVWAARMLGAPIPERLNVTDMIIDVVGRLADQGSRLALVGGRPGEAEAFAAVARQAHPHADFVHTETGFLDDAAVGRLLVDLEHKDPDVVFLGMGSPLQEQRMASWSLQGAARTWWCVGGAFGYFAGSEPRAPRWMQRAGLEWLFRFAADPRRLAGRYLIGNPRFMATIALAAVRRQRSKDAT